MFNSVVWVFKPTKSEEKQNVSLCVCSSALSGFKSYSKSLIEAAFIQLHLLEQYSLQYL